MLKLLDWLICRLKPLNCRKHQTPCHSYLLRIKKEFGIKRKQKIWGILHCMLMGWWGVWGLIMTPIQIMRNFFGAFRKPDLAVTTPQLEQMLRVDIAQQVMAQGAPGPV